MHRVVTRWTSGIFEHQILNHIEQGWRNDRFMCVLRSHPVRFIFSGSVLNLMVWSRSLTLNQSSGIHLILQNAIDCNGTPFRLNLLFEAGLVLGTTKSLVLIRGWYTVFIQPVRNLCRTVTIQLHTEDCLNNRGYRLVNDQFVFIVLGSEIAVEDMVSNKFSVSSLDVQIGTDLDGNISAVRVVNQVLEWENDFISRLPRLCRVIIVVNCDKANAKCRENLFNVSARINVVTTETRKVFYNDAVDFSLLDLLNHFLKIRTVKVRTCETVITELLNKIDFRVLGQVIFNQFSLICDTVTFFLLTCRRIAIFLR